MSAKKRDYAATGFGILTSLVTALTLIDFDQFSFEKPNDVVKLLVVLLPAIGGHVSTIKKSEPKVDGNG